MVSAELTITAGVQSNAKVSLDKEENVEQTGFDGQDNVVKGVDAMGEAPRP
jgi:hypothetical protein